MARIKPVRQNKLTIRNRFDEAKRVVALFVAPKGTIRYTLDGSEARNGNDYISPLEIGNEAATVYVFAECDGLESKQKFSFPASGSKEVLIIREKPATLYSVTPKRLDNSAKTYEALKIAKEKNITFEQVSLTLGSAPKVINLALGEMKIDPHFIETTLTHLQSLLLAESPVVMSFKRVHVPTGYDLEQFCKALGIEIQNGEVIQE